MNDRNFNVLFLCTGNSARSIIAESVLNHVGRGRFRGFSAGSHPTGVVNPHALALLQRLGLPTEGLHSKGWDVFAQVGAPMLDFVFTVCDNAAGEVCPVYPGQPLTAHLGVPDPAAFEGSELDKANAFHEAFVTLKRRIDLFASLPLESLDRMAMQSQVRDIGKA